MYTVDNTATMLSLKFMIQGRTGQPAHSFWLQKPDGTRLTGGLAMQGRLIDQGVCQGTELHVTCATEAASFYVTTDQVREDRIRDVWVDAHYH